MNNMIPVPVIASFSTEGKIMPLYFRYKDYGSIPVTIKTYIKYITCSEPPTTKVAGFSVNNSIELSITELSP